MIAMGFPSSGLESFVRNSMDQVKAFLAKRHGAYFKVYNLCIEKERQYPEGTFERMASFGFHDHIPPSIDQMERFCQDAVATSQQEQFIRENNMNVAVVHCKAGKGRTGTMVCAYLLHSKMFDAARDALLFYGLSRTSDGNGVTIPSQRRYVYYYEHMVAKKLTYADLPRRIHSIVRIFFGPKPNVGSLSAFSSLC